MRVTARIANISVQISKDIHKFIYMDIHDLQRYPSYGFPA